MEKIGVLTQYYNSANYGGLLQAYALVKVLNNYGMEAEQISYNANNYIAIDTTNSNKTKLRAFLSRFAQKILRLWISNGVRRRYKKVAKFRSSIPHSKNVFFKNNIKESNQCYDYFVVGSDQVWNPKDYDPIFFLSFVNQNKKKIAYAASIGQSQLTDNQCKIYKEHLISFDAISLRENNISLIQSLVNIPVKWTLDPTLLLDKEDWDKVAAEQIFDQDYIFCYFLGKDRELRKIAKEFAKRKKMCLVSMPHLTGAYQRCDSFFGDKKVIDASPEEFISLIKHAKYVLTDSFHASVFSIIYKKEFFIFERKEFKGMSSRIYSLLELFDGLSHFCDDIERRNVDYLLNTDSLDYSNVEKLNVMQIESKDFLLKAILK